MSEAKPPEADTNWRYLTPQLPVRDVRETQRFYRDVFGCRIAWIYEEEYGAVYHGRVEIYFSQTDEDFAPVWNFVRVENADAVLEVLRARGAEIVEEIDSKPWGMREFTVVDNNGHRFRIGHSDGPVVPSGQAGGRP